MNISPLILAASLLLTVHTALAGWVPYCTAEKSNQPRIIAYLGADSSWELKDKELAKLDEQLGKVTLVNYAFARFGKDGQGNTVLTLSPGDIKTIQQLRQLRPDLPVMIAVGGWGDREGFKFLEQEEQITVFVDSVKTLLQQYQLDGIDVDWENELLASDEEIAGVTTLLKRLHETLRGEGYCVSNAVPATSAYWRHYPSGSQWQAYVNWTTVMAYDHYGTFGPRTELGAALYDPQRRDDPTYPYPTTSGNQAIKHYYRQGLPADKLILGVPFYCHSYYVSNQSIADNADYPGLYMPVIDANISSQISYDEAYQRYGDALFAHAVSYAKNNRQAVTFYGLIPLEKTDKSRFLSCENPQAIRSKVDYVKGSNPLSDQVKMPVRLGGISFWSLQQDLPFSSEKSLLRTLYTGFVAADSGH